ncbi:MAG: CapA family protein [Bacteroidales bacterium]|nr:CapA family protein [Bacteroidales bacterium]
MHFASLHKFLSTTALIFTMLAGSTHRADAQERYPEICFPYPFPMELLIPSNDTLEICVMGDVMMHTKQIENARRKDSGYDFSSYFQFIEDEISSADIAVANMEFTLAGEPYTGYPCFSAPDSLARYLAECGFDVFLTANNHIYDKGVAGAARTLKTYRELAEEYGIAIAGMAEDELSTGLVTLNAKGISIAFVNMTYGTNLGIGSYWPKVCRLSDRQTVEETMAKAAQCDVTIALPHWGEEYNLIHNARQEKDAEWLISQGADVIIGAHPHVIQDCRKIDGVTVAYSLGNAVSNMSAANTQLELMATIRIVRHLNGRIEIMEPGFRYLWCSRPGGYNSSYTVLPVKDFIGSRDLWQGPWEYDKMMRTYRHVQEKTRITEQ